MIQKSTHFISLLIFLSVFTLPILAQTSDDYCQITSAQTSYEWIDKVAFADFSNESGNDGGYGDYTELSTDLMQGKTYEMMLTPGYAANPYGEHWSIFVDWNGDGDFYDNKEKINTGIGTAITTVTISLKVPVEATLGATRLRIMMHYDGMNINSCKQFSWGEVEDYTVNIVAGDGTEDEDIDNTPVDSSGYCLTEGGQTTYEWIDKVTFGDIVNMSGNDGGYGNYMNLSTEVMQGGNYSITLQPGFNGMVYQEYWSVYIDFNGDGDFKDMNERVVHTFFPKLGEWEKTFNVPLSATLGETRMRVIMHYGKAAPNACASLNWGEVEDYSINIIAYDSSMIPEDTDSTGTTDPQQPVLIEYCEMFGQNSAYEWIESVKVGDTENMSGNDSGYGDYTDMVVTLEQGETHQLNLTPGFSAGNYKENWSIFIDWDGNGDFEENELVFKTMFPKMQPINDALEIPADAPLGSTRMRIAMRYKKGNYVGCGMFGWGEVEDYMVNIIESDGIDNDIIEPDPEPEVEVDSLVFSPEILDNLNLPVDGWNDIGLLANLIDVFFPDFEYWDNPEAVAGLIQLFFPDYDAEAYPDIVDMLMEIYGFMPFPEDSIGMPDMFGESDWMVLNGISMLLEMGEIDFDMWDDPEAVMDLINTLFPDYEVNPEIVVILMDIYGMFPFPEDTFDMPDFPDDYDWMVLDSIMMLAETGGIDFNMWDDPEAITDLINTVFPDYEVNPEIVVILMDMFNFFPFPEDTFDMPDFPDDYDWMVLDSIMMLAETGGIDFNMWDDPEAITDLINTVFPDYEVNPEIVVILMDMFNFFPFPEDTFDMPDFPDDFSILDSLLMLNQTGGLDFDMWNDPAAVMDLINTLFPDYDVDPVIIDMLVSMFGGFPFLDDSLDIDIDIPDFPFDNDLGDNWQNWLDSIDFVEGYCEMVGTNANYEWIEQVSLGTLDNTSGTDNGYGNYSDMVVELIQGNEYTITLTPGFKNLSYPEHWNVFIDFDQDGTFNNDEEWVYVGFNPTSETIEATITVPEGTALGTTLMRVVMQYDFDFMFQPCGNFSFGEVEDYTVEIIDGTGKTQATNNDKTTSNDLIINTYPNPASNWLNIQLEQNTDNEVDIQLRDITGKTVATYRQQAVAGKNNFRLDLPTLAAGYYTIHLISNDKISTQKVLIQQK